MTYQVLAIDDHEVARSGLTHLLESAQVRVSHSTGDMDEVLSFLQHQQCDAVLLDIRMPDFNGLEALDKLRLLYPDLPILILSSYDNPTYIARAAALGASDYLFKMAGRREIIEAIVLSVENKGPLPESRFARICEKMQNEVDLAAIACKWPLTSRESQVLLHISLGLSNKEIAKSLLISVETVKEHVQNILRKMEATDRTDAAVKAVRQGFVG